MYPNQQAYYQPNGVPAQRVAQVNGASVYQATPQVYQANGQMAMQTGRPVQGQAVIHPQYQQGRPATSPGAQFQSYPQGNAHNQFQPQHFQAQYQPQPQVQAQAQYQPQPQVQAQAQYQPQPQYPPQVQAQPQAQYQAQPLPQAQAKVQAHAQYQHPPQGQPQLQKPASAAGATGVDRVANAASVPATKMHAPALLQGFIGSKKFCEDAIVGVLPTPVPGRKGAYSERYREMAFVEVAGLETEGESARKVAEKVPRSMPVFDYAAEEKIASSDQ